MTSGATANRAAQQEEKGPERTWMESGSFARGALVRRGERTGTPASLPGRRIRAEETAPTMLRYAHRPPSPGRGLNTHGDKARAGRRGNTWGGVRGVRRQSSGGPSRQKMRPFRRVGGGGRARSRSERNTVGRSLRVRDSPLIRTGSKRSRSTRLPTTLAAQLLDTNPIGRRGAALAGRDETTSRQEV